MRWRFLPITYTLLEDEATDEGNGKTTLYPASYELGFDDNGICLKFLIVTDPAAVEGQVKVRSEKRELKLRAKTMVVADVRYKDCGEMAALSLSNSILCII